MKAVLVEWADHMKADGPLQPGDAETKRPCKRKSLGFVVSESDTHLTIAQDISVEVSGQVEYHHLYCLDKRTIERTKEIK